MAVFVGDARPAHMRMVAGLLRHEVRLHIVERGRAPCADFRAVTVGVGLPGAGAVELQLRVAHGQRPFEAEEGQARRVRLTGPCGLDVQPHRTIDAVAHRHSGMRVVRELIPVFAGELATLWVPFHLPDAGDHARIAPRAEPLRAVEAAARAAVVVGQRPECDESRHAGHHLPRAVAHRDDAALRARQQHLTRPQPHAAVPTTQRDARTGFRCARGVPCGERTRVECAGALPPGELMAGLGPRGGAREPLAHFVDHLMRVQCAVTAGRQHVLDRREHEVERARLAGGHVECARGAPHLTPVDEHARHEHAVARADKGIAVVHEHAVGFHADAHRRILRFHFLGFRRWRAVREHDAVAAEVHVAWPVAEVTAVREPLRAVVQPLPQRLVDEIPDEAALVVRIPLKGGVFAQTTERIAHRVHVFARDVRFGRVVLKVVADVVGPRVHARFEVGDRAVRQVPLHALVMHRARGVPRAAPLPHLFDHRARIRLVAERPRDHARMVAVTRHHALHTVHACGKPHRVIAGDRLTVRHVTGQIPAAMRLQIGFVDHVDAVFVAQFEPTGLVRVVRGAHRVDVVPFHEAHIPQHVLFRDAAAIPCVEFVAVDAAQHDPLAVDGEDATFDLDMAEPNHRA